MSVQLSGAEEGDNITLGGEITFTCSVEAVPGLTSVSWYRGEQLLETRDLVTEDQRLVDSLTLDTANLEAGEAVILCRPDLVTAGFNNNDMAASVRINLIEEHEYDSNEVEYYDDEEDEEYYDDDYASSEEEESYESVTEIVTSNPPRNSDEMFDTEETTPASSPEVSDATEESTDTDTTTSSSFLEHEYDDQEDAASQTFHQDIDQTDESQYRDYNYDDGASATDYYEGASYHQDYSFGNNDIDREEIILTDEHSEDFKRNDEARDATERKEEEEEDAATNSFTSREKVLAQTKQRSANGNNIATFSEKQLRSGSSKLGSHCISQAVLLLLMFKLL